MDEAVKKYYDEHAQEEWERLEKHPFEFLLTTYMMDRHISAGDSVLDVGGGPGRYSLYYARKGCAVTLVDLSEGNVALARQKAEALNTPLTAYAHDCLTLDTLVLPQFDHVFLMGPLYHLPLEKDRERAVRQALACLKPGGFLYVSFILDFAGFIYDLKNGPGQLPIDLQNAESRKLIDAVINGTAYSGPAFTDVCFMSPRQIEPFMARFPLEKEHLFGQEGFLSPNENQVLSYPEQEREMWLDIAKRFLELPEFLSFSEHAMFIGRKKAST